MGLVNVVHETTTEEMESRARRNTKREVSTFSVAWGGGGAPSLFVAAELRTYDISLTIKSHKLFAHRRYAHLPLTCWSIRKGHRTGRFGRAPSYPRLAGLILRLLAFSPRGTSLCYYRYVDCVIGDRFRSSVGVYDSSKRFAEVL